jgi:hypothetical protein
MKSEDKGMSEIYTDENGKEYTKEEMEAEVDRRVKARTEERREIFLKLKILLRYENYKPSVCGYPNFIHGAYPNYAFMFEKMIQAKERPIVFMDGRNVVCCLKENRFVNRDLFVMDAQRREWVICKTFIQWMESNPEKIEQDDSNRASFPDCSEIDEKIYSLVKDIEGFAYRKKFHFVVTPEHMAGFYLLEYMMDEGALATLEGSSDGKEVICTALNGKVENRAPYNLPTLAIGKTFIEWMELKNV